jgi:acyl-CoA reductase-like NAD-dependent aldehyde dehydrogenase
MGSSATSFETRLFINGQYVDGKSSSRLTCYSAIDNSVVTDAVHVAEQEDVDDAVAAAQAAFPSWSGKLPEARAAILLRIADLIEQNVDELARLEALCSGKPVSNSKTVEIPLAAKTFRCKCLRGPVFPIPCLP